MENSQQLTHANYMHELCLSLVRISHMQTTCKLHAQAIAFIGETYTHATNCTQPMVENDMSLFHLTQRHMLKCPSTNFKRLVRMIYANNSSHLIIIN